MEKDGRLNNLKKNNKWRCSVCRAIADYNDSGDKLCTKHWCLKKGLPYGRK